MRERGSLAVILLFYHHVLPRKHSVVQRLRHLSFHAGTWCMFMQTARWQASVHASLSVPSEVRAANVSSSAALWIVLPRRGGGFEIGSTTYLRHHRP